MPSILMQHFSSASFISDYEIRQLATRWMDGGCFVCVHVCMHKTCIQRVVACIRLQSWNPGSAGESCDTIALAQLSEAYHAAGLRGAAPAHCWDSGAKNTLSRVILQNWTKALFLWRERCHRSVCSTTDLQSSCCFLEISHFSKHSLIESFDILWPKIKQDTNWCSHLR